MNPKNDICILLTACVNPNGMIFTALQDSNERQRQYEDALNYYLTQTGVTIVFVENTGCDFSSKYSEYIQQGRLEYITFQGNDYDKTLGKGYGEYKILMYADQHSSVLRRHRYVVKITGRIKVLNINKLLASKWLFFSHVFRCDFRQTDYLWSMVIILETRKLMEIFKTNGERLNDSQGVYFEHVLYEGMAHDKKTLAIPFMESPLIDGVCGTSNTSYSELVGKDNRLENLLLASEFYAHSGRWFFEKIFRLVYKMTRMRLKRF